MLDVVTNSSFLFEILSHPYISPSADAKLVRSSTQVSIVSDLKNLLECSEQYRTRITMIENLLELIGKLKEQTEHLGRKMEDINKSVLDSIATMLEGFRISVEQLQKERNFLESLFFEEMNQRYHAISEAHTKTFSWIFEPDWFDEWDPRSMVAFKQWLLFGNGIFWVSGKPGSGKSTLMKYLYTCGLTEEYLRCWAKDDTLIILASFFWMGGTIMQRSQRGLLQ